MNDARFTILEVAYTQLMTVSRNSHLIDVTPLDAEQGVPPSKYLVTYRCRGIACLTAEGPELCEYHEMELQLSTRFPHSPPTLRWRTKIWHPNINRQNGHVCTNQTEYWYSERSLAEVITEVGEMIQFKWYFAEIKPPYPEDWDVAEWVRTVAEPQGLIGPDAALDSRPLVEARKIVAAPRRIHLPLGFGNAPATPKGRIFIPGISSPGSGSAPSAD